MSTFKSKTFCFEVEGDLAMYADPLLRTAGEKYSYPIPTYEALKGIAKSIYWKPTFEWKIDRIRVMKKIRHHNKGALVPAWDCNSNNEAAHSKKRELFGYTYLEDVCYQVECHYEWNMNYPQFKRDRNPAKHDAIIERSIRRGGTKDVFLGTRECQAMVRPCVFGEGESDYDENTVDWPFGLMYYRKRYPDEIKAKEEKGCLVVSFWEPKMNAAENGVGGIVEYDIPEEMERKRIVKRGLAIKQFPDIGNGEDGNELDQ